MTEYQNMDFANQHIQRAEEQAVLIDQKHWLVPSDMKVLLTALNVDYDLVCKYLPDSASRLEIMASSCTFA